MIVTASLYQDCATPTNSAALGGSPPARPAASAGFQPAHRVPGSTPGTRCQDVEGLKTPDREEQDTLLSWEDIRELPAG